MLGFNCSHASRIRRSIGAVVGLFLIGSIVLGASFFYFDSKLKSTIPQSMQDTRPIHHDSNIWIVFLVISAAAGLPLMAFVIDTLSKCQEKELQNS